MAPLHLGIDFDNTLVCYDEVFRSVAVGRGLVPPATPGTKEAVRDHLRATGREEAWTELQGAVYGRHLQDAPAFPGAVAFLVEARRRGLPVSIISHKTRVPYRGPATDLHRAALDWLASHGFFDPAGIGLTPDRVCFRETKEAKLGRIASAGCSHFVDDLPEILLAETFPAATARLLFAPRGSPAPRASGLAHMSSWGQIHAYFTPLWRDRS
jgi:hypothetical protein